MASKRTGNLFIFLVFLVIVIIYYQYAVLTWGPKITSKVT